MCIVRSDCEETFKPLEQQLQGFLFPFLVIAFGNLFHAWVRIRQKANVVMSQHSLRNIAIYDTTLRDGSQGEGISFSLQDKLAIASRLAEFGIDYIEGGYPMSNEKDAEFFAKVRKLDLGSSRICAFGMTRRRGMKAADDPGMQGLVAAETPVCTVVGKSWDFHATEVLNVSLAENLDMIGDSVEFITRHAECVYDAEHFFDGFKANQSTHARPFAPRRLLEPSGLYCATQTVALGPRRLPKS